MSKKDNNQNESAQAKLNPGTVILTGKSREEVSVKFDELKASAKDATLMAGAVGRRSDDGTFELRIDIANN